MKRPPVPRSRIYDLYWYFASERQQMFARRVTGEPEPWTDDPILREFKFCNVFRAADRVSQYMIRDVCYHDEPCTDEDRLFQIVAFRTFSKTATWRTARDFLGRYPVLDDLADGAFTRALEHARTSNGGLYTGAFILCATDAYGQSAKHRNHIELFRHMFLHDQLGAKLLEARSLREVYELLHGYPLMGDFMSYQTTIDLNYSELIGFSENEFTQAGPGALRGIKKCFEDLGDYTPAEIVLWMTERQDEEFARLGLPFGGLWGRPLHAIDCQGLFCETDKYCREAAPELASARKRIKARFTPTPEPIRLFFPPKWGINDKLPSQPVLSDAKPAQHEQAACSDPRVRRPSARLHRSQSATKSPSGPERGKPGIDGSWFSGAVQQAGTARRDAQNLDGTDGVLSDLAGRSPETRLDWEDIWATRREHLERTWHQALDNPDLYYPQPDKDPWASDGPDSYSDEPPF